MKSRQRRSFSAEMKARIALEAIKEQKTIQEIASHYGVHPSQVTSWKRQAIQGAPALFADRRSQPDTSEDYNPRTSEIFVTDRSGGSTKFFNGETYELVKTIELI